MSSSQPITVRVARGARASGCDPGGRVSLEDYVAGVVPYEIERARPITLRVRRWWRAPRR